MLFGVVSDTWVWTPSGERPIGELRVGDPVIAVAWPSGVEHVATVTALHAGRTASLYALVAEGSTLAGITPGALVWDAFEEMFRGAGSLSALTELVVRGEDGQHRVVPLADAAERLVGEADVMTVELSGDAPGFWIGGVLARHGVPR